MSKIEKNVPPENSSKADIAGIKKLVIYCRKYIPLIFLSLIFSVLANAGSIFGPRYISEITDIMTEGIYGSLDLGSLRAPFTFLIVLYVSSAALSYFQQFITNTVTVHVTKNLRNDIGEKLNHLPLSFFDGAAKGELQSRVTNDVTSMSSTLSECAPSLMKAVVLFVGVLIMMFRTNVGFTLVTIASSVLGFAAVIILAGKSQKYFDSNQSLLGKMNAHIEEVFTNHSIVSSFGGEEKERAAFRETSAGLYEANWKSQVISGFMTPIMTLFGDITYVLIFALGVSQIAKGNGDMSLGTIVAFTIYTRQLSSPLQAVTQTISSLQQASAASKRVFEILEHEELREENQSVIQPETVRGEVEFRNVSFGYKPETTVIDNFSVKLESGQKVAIVGPTGAGKTTIVNLLMRFYEPDSGEILIDGVPLRDMSRRSVHGLFDMILQDTWLFTGTIRENLVYNRVNIPDSKLDEICAAVGLRHFIETLPLGYDTKLSDCINLSEGQKQQLTIARAMLSDSPMLILDEATSAVDSRTELYIQRAMDELTKGRSSFVIAHRLSTIKDADTILVMRGGGIAEVGTHSELLKKGGFYAELYASQFAPVN